MKRYIISLLSIILVLVLIAPAMASSVSITLWGTNGNASGAQQNATKYGANNSVNVSAWNVTKTFQVRSLNVSGDTISFNISNNTPWRVYELKANGTAINGYQATENGMVNFSYSQNNSNVTYSLSPAVNSNGYNMTWAHIWNIKSTAAYSNSTMVEDTVYRNTGKPMILILGYTINNGDYGVCIRSGAQNPPTANTYCSGKASVSGGLEGQVMSYINATDYYLFESGASTSNTKTIRVIL